ncbi:hypothetical protein [Lactococcus protaetiae]|uniref:hypothetical protein n=1 Tax=Lactococcus protaetiae TaxID=2592653 RepID=UPI001CC1F493|nr:hypothetical protein [Lactococcus protaetiae]
MLKSVVPTSSTDFEGTTIPQPSRPALNIKLPTEAINGTSFGYQSSIAGLTGVTAGQIEVIKNGVSVQNYTSVTDSNVQAALQYIYSNADNSSDFVLFIGGNVTLSATTMGNTTTGGTFASLNGKVKSITIIANTTDSLVSSPNVAAVGSFTITTPTNNYFGASTAFRNVNVAAGNHNFYAQGNPIAFMPGSNFTGTGISVYGGTDGTSSVTGDTNIYVGSTGTGTMSFYGGNNAGGNISGSTHVSITNASGLGTVTGGNASGGTISGDTNVSVTGFTGNIANMYGAGVGTSANPVTVNGDVYNNWNSTISGASYNGTYYGGAGYGTIKGTIYNTFKGLGSYNGEEMYNGGVQNGTVGVSGSTNSAIVNDYDTSKFTGGYANFAGIAGANNAGEVIVMLLLCMVTSSTIRKQDMAQVALPLWVGLQALMVQIIFIIQECLYLVRLMMLIQRQQQPLLNLPLQRNFTATLILGFVQDWLAQVMIIILYLVVDMASSKAIQSWKLEMVQLHQEVIQLVRTE